jgi:dUTP pyrophosphatase
MRLLPAKESEMQLKVKLLRPEAKLPVCAHPGEDLGYDIFSADRREVEPGEVATVGTGISVEMYNLWFEDYHMHAKPYGFLLRDRSSMANKGISVIGGVIDAGYRGEIFVQFVNHTTDPYYIHVGDKIAQLIPTLPETHAEVVAVSELSDTTRGAAGFGSTGV